MIVSDDRSSEQKESFLQESSKAEQRQVGSTLSNGPSSFASSDVCEFSGAPASFKFGQEMTKGKEENNVQILTN